MASVTYTRPASASPEVTFVTTSVTFCSSETGLKVKPVFSASCFVAAPQGTCSAQTTSFTPSFVTSSSFAMPAGLLGGVISVRVLVAKIFVFAASTFPASEATFICFSLADAKTSASAPLLIWVASSEEPAKENSIV